MNINGLVRIAAYFMTRRSASRPVFASRIRFVISISSLLLLAFLSKVEAARLPIPGAPPAPVNGRRDRKGVLSGVIRLRGGHGQARSQRIGPGVSAKAAYPMTALAFLQCERFVCRFTGIALGYTCARLPSSEEEAKKAALFRSARGDGGGHACNGRLD